MPSKSHPGKHAADPRGRLGAAGVVIVAGVFLVLGAGAWWALHAAGEPAGGSATPPVAALATMALTVKDFTFTAEIARTDADRQRGLMNRPPLPDAGAMLFVYPVAAQRRFWMRNTPSPLSIAFIDDDGVIVEIHDLVPFSERQVQSAVPVRLALEVRRGRFDELGVAIGDRFTWVEDPFNPPPM